MKAYTHVIISSTNCVETMVKYCDKCVLFNTNLLEFIIASKIYYLKCSVLGFQKKYNCIHVTQVYMSVCNNYDFFCRAIQIIQTTDTQI